MRYETVHPGIRSRHEFSAGAHYDPDNVAFGPVVGLDEHLVEPGAGFDRHGHRGVHIVSWVLDGVLRHEDSAGGVRFVPPGALLVQSAGDGISHSETNASDTDGLRFVQLTVLGSDSPGVRLVAAPAEVAGVTVEVTGRYSGVAATPRLVCTARGEVFRLGAGEPLPVDQAGELLVVTLAALPPRS